jgi:regulatory protein
MMKKDAEKNVLNEKIDEKVLFNKIMKYCGYQERSEHDVIEKLKPYRLGMQETHSILRRLKEEKFIDDQRYARIYTSGKLRNKKWGRIKIRYELQKKKIASQYIEESLNSIDEEEYFQTMTDLINKKKASLKEMDLYILKNKVAQFLFSKGFENDLVWDLINRMIP